MARTFEDAPAVRKRVPLWFGLAGPSGGGKTFSALRIAAGIQRVTGGDVFVIDSESSRALHYAELFKFRHVPFTAPFSPLDYLAAVEHCVARKAGVIVIDSCSHEHEGPGGVLEWHDHELEKMGGRAADSFRAWSKPKAARRRLINTMLQMPANFVLCFRAADKAKPVKGEKELRQMGWMPIAPNDWVYECTAMALLLPGAKGFPTWDPEHQGERSVVKLPQQFEKVFAERQQLSEDIGEQLARWAAGDAAVSKPAAAPVARSAFDVTDLLAGYEAAASLSELAALEKDRAEIWRKINPKDQAALKAAVEKTRARLGSQKEA